MRIFKDSFLYISASMIEKILPFLLMPFLTRILTPSEYGTVTLFAVSITIYSLLIGTSLNGYVRIIYHKTNFIEFKNHLSNVFFIIICLFIVASLATFFFKDTLITIVNMDIKYLYFALILSFFRSIIDLHLVLYQTMRQAGKFVFIQISKSLLESFLIIFLVFYLLDGVQGRINSIIYSTIIIGSICLYSIFQKKLFNTKVNLSYIKRILKFFLPLWPHSIAVTVIFSIDKFILTTKGLSFIGELSVASALAFPLSALAESINKAYMPWSLEYFKQGKFNLVVGASYILLIIFLVITIFYSLTIHLIFEFLVGENFQNSLYPAMYLLWIGLIKLIYYIFIKSLHYSENMKFMSFITLPSAFIYLFLITINLSNVTLVDVSIYIILFHMMMTAGVIYLSQKNFPQPWTDFKSILKVIRIIQNK